MVHPVISPHNELGGICMAIKLNLLFLIFGINVLYLTINTLRLLFQAKGLIWVAPICGALEIVLYTLGLHYVLNSLSNPWYLLAYAVGFGVGIALGMLIDRLLAIGYKIVQIIVPPSESTADQENLVELLRHQGFGVTEFNGAGRDGQRLILEVLVPRRQENTVYETVLAFNARAFMISLDPTYFHGGFWVKRHPRR